MKRPRIKRWYINPLTPIKYRLENYADDENNYSVTIGDDNEMKIGRDQEITELETYCDQLEITISDLKSALQKIAVIPDALYKSDAVKMRTIARDALRESH